MHKECTRKTSLNLHLSFCLISVATKILEGWDIIHLKDKIVAPSGVQKIFCTIKGSRDISKSNQIYNALDTGQSSVLKSDVPYHFNYISASLKILD